MTLTAKDVAEITRLLEESSFDELHLELDGLKLTLRRNGAPPQREASPAEPEGGRQGPAAAPAPAGEPRGDRSGNREPPAPEELPPNRHAVTAPMLGTFYRAPKPGAAPFVEVGSDVKEDSIIGIIEVMKLMNTVRAGTRGRVLEILAEDGGLVEYGQALLLVETPAPASEA